MNTDRINLTLNKIEILETKLNNIDHVVGGHTDSLGGIVGSLREIRDVNGEQDLKLDRISKTTTNIPAAISLMNDKIDNFKMPEIKVEEKQDDVEITNPDVQLLKEMFETSQKLNEMILKTALSITEEKELNVQKNESDIEQGEVNQEENNQ